MKRALFRSIEVSFRILSIHATGAAFEREGTGFDSGHGRTDRRVLSEAKFNHTLRASKNVLRDSVILQRVDHVIKKSAAFMTVGPPKDGSHSGPPNSGARNDTARNR
ncbi:hypothetical protein EVAR_59083_1 [Eumeta japonica]|uniref:Uncharacterized protein n=1 Tax=Eumeta variegata TaxID=151549 RepID=A0A4C1YWS4_EUMVA|nr:hypothetical protein EVAR_59083_1 [Eumeta japonica]